MRPSCLTADKPVPSIPIALLMSVSGRPHAFQHAHPSAHPRRRGTFARTDARVPPIPSLTLRLVAHFFRLGLLPQNLRLLCQTRHVRVPVVLGTRGTCARRPSPVADGGLHAYSTSGPSCPPHFLNRTATPPAYFLFALYCSAPPAFIFLQRLSWPPLSSAAPGIQPHNSACCSVRISCPRKAKLGSADGALREDHLFYGRIARGSPTMQAPATKACYALQTPLRRAG